MPFLRSLSLPALALWVVAGTFVSGSAARTARADGGFAPAANVSPVFPTTGPCPSLLAWLDGAVPTKVCAARAGSQCDLVKTTEEGLAANFASYGVGATVPTAVAVCLALGGNNCALAQNLTQGVCYGLSQTQCALRGDEGEAQAKREIRNFCELRYRQAVIRAATPAPQVR